MLLKTLNHKKHKDVTRSFSLRFFVMVLCMLNMAYAQQVLTLTDALSIALQNNYSIQVAKNDADITKNNNQVGAAGMLPSVTGTATQDNQQVDANQKFNTGIETNRKNANTHVLSANVELGWTLFDGLKMFATKNKLEELQNIGELRMRSQIEQTFVRVIRAYYDVVLAKQQLKANQDAVELSKQRFTFADEKFKAGKSSKTEMLQAQVDLNTDKSNMMRQQNTLRNNKTTLNQLLARDVSVPFDVPDSLTVNPDVKLEEIQNKSQSQNANLLIAKKNQQVNLLAVREVRAERMPVIQFKSGYNYNRLQSEAGALQFSTTNGFHYGAGLAINLFNGFDVNRRLQNNQILLRSSELVYKDSLLKVQAAVSQAYNNYTTSLELLKFEQDNLLVNGQNFDIASEQYKIGVITAIELRQAQQNLLLSKTRLLLAQYETRLNETELRRLSGELLQINLQ
jgi:outer membrane protein